MRKLTFIFILLFAFGCNPEPVENLTCGLIIEKVGSEVCEEDEIFIQVCFRCTWNNRIVFLDINGDKELACVNIDTYNEIEVGGYLCTENFVTWNQQ